MRRLTLIFLFSLVVSCQTAAPPPSMSWSEHQKHVIARESFLLNGRLNIREGNKSDTVNMQWRQLNENFEIRLSGTLGLGAVLITGNHQIIKVERSGEEPLYAESLEQLTTEWLGYRFPASELYYWLRGIPVPDCAAEVSFDEHQQLQSLSQQDSLGKTWELNYDRYRYNDGLSMPGRIKLDQPPFRLTVIVNEWTFDPPQLLAGS